MPAAACTAPDSIPAELAVDRQSSITPTTKVHLRNAALLSVHKAVIPQSCLPLRKAVSVSQFILSSSCVR